MGDKTRIALAIGDPAGIGPEISLKAARDASVRHACRPFLVGDVRVLQRHAAACRIPVDLHVIARVQHADWSAERVNVLDCAQTGLAAFEFGAPNAACGQATLAFAAAAIKAALADEVDGVVAAPQTKPRSRVPVSPSTAIPRSSRARPEWTRTTSSSCSASTTSRSSMPRCTGACGTRSR